MPETEIHVEPVRPDGNRHHEHHDDESWMEQHHVHSDRDMLVPLVDEQEAGRIYDPSLLHWALWGALLGTVLLGWLGTAMANGDLPIAGLGQWAASGPLLASVTGGGLGIAVGGLIGALLALYRMPALHPEQHEEHPAPERVVPRTAPVPEERVVAEPVPEHR